MREAQSRLTCTDLLCAPCRERIAKHCAEFTPSYDETPQQREVRWYRRFGKYQDRIRGGQTGEYVIGDWSWNRLHPERAEVVEPIMQAAGVYSGSA